MGKITRYKKKNYIYFVKVKNLNDHLINSFNIIKKEKIPSLTTKIERNFV